MKIDISRVNVKKIFPNALMFRRVMVNYPEKSFILKFFGFALWIEISF